MGITNPQLKASAFGNADEREGRRHPHSEMRMNESRIVIHGGGYASRIRRERLVRICAYVGAVSGVIAAVASIVALLR